MQGIIIATLVVGVVGLVLGLALVTASKKFYVEVDDRVTKVRECLRGAPIVLLCATLMAMAFMGFSGLS